MKDLKISVNKETRYVNLAKTVIGVDGENLQEKIVFSFEDEFVDGTARLEYENTDGKQYVLLEKENETYTIPVKNVITKKGEIKMQLVITEGTDEENIPVFKSNQFYLWCEEAINAVKEAPDSYELWIETANEKLNEVDNLDIDLIEEEKETKITITRKDGTVKETTIAGGDKATNNYEQLNNLPKINGVELIGNLTDKDLKIETINLVDLEAEQSVLRNQLMSSIDEKRNIIKLLYINADGEILQLKHIDKVEEGIKFLFENTWLDEYEERKYLNVYDIYLIVPDDENAEIIFGGNGTEISDTLYMETYVEDYFNENKEALVGPQGEQGPQGIPGENGYTPVKGVDYFDGEPGEQGIPGEPGYTPVKGTDYWTEEDISEIEAYINNSIDEKITSALESDY